MNKVLIVEDSRFFRNAIKRTLTDFGYEVVEASDGQEGLELLMVDPEIEVAVVDWNMPRLAGPEFCQRAKILRQESFIYCILFTSENETRRLIEGIDAGADDYIVKSKDFDELHARIRAGLRIVQLQQKLQHEKEQLKETNETLQRTAYELKEKEMKLAQRSRLESIGSLAAGVAHEINTPVQFIRDNTLFVREELKNLSALYTAFEEVLTTLPEEQREHIEALKRLLDFDYLAVEIPLALEQTLNGVGSISNIVRSVKEISRPSADQYKSCDLNQVIRDAVAITRGEWKKRTRMKLDLDEELEEVFCSQVEVGQVIVQLISNASSAIKRSDKLCGEICISTLREHEGVRITVSDNGCGISGELKQRVFDPFFTTQDVGEGSGNGLALAYATIVDRHKGEIAFESTEGVGSSCWFTLPMKEKYCSKENLKEVNCHIV